MIRQLKEKIKPSRKDIEYVLSLYSLLKGRLLDMDDRNVYNEDLQQAVVCIKEFLDRTTRTTRGTKWKEKK